MMKQRKPTRPAKKEQPARPAEARPSQALGPGVRIVARGPGKVEVIPLGPPPDSGLPAAPDPDTILAAARELFQETLNRRGPGLMRAEAERKTREYLISQATLLPLSLYVQAAREVVSRPEWMLEGEHQRQVYLALTGGKKLPARVLEDYPDLLPKLHPDPAALPLERWVGEELERLAKPLKNRGYVRWDVALEPEKNGERRFTHDKVRAELALGQHRKAHPKYCWEIETDESCEALHRYGGKRIYCLCGRREIAKSDLEEIRARLAEEHRSAVEAAVQRGDRIALEVLVAYPDLLVDAAWE